jgi:hypothetical protein
VPKIINAFRGTSPVADSISKLGLAMFGDSLSGDLKRAQLEALQRENTETQALGLDVEAAGGADKAFTSGTTQGRIISSGYKPDDFLKLSRGSAYVSDSPIAEKFSLGAGDSASSLPSSFATDQNNQMARHGMTLEEQRRHNMSGEGLEQDKFGFEKEKWYSEPQKAVENGQPAFVPRSQLTQPGVQPQLSETESKSNLANGMFYDLTSEEQKAYLGADVEVGTTRMLKTPSGMFRVTDESYAKGLDAQGHPLPPPTTQDVVGTIEGGGDTGLTNAQETNSQKAVIANRKLKFLVKQGLELTRSPDAAKLFGAPGAVRGMGQELLQGAKGLLQIAPQAAPELGQAQNELRAMGLSSLIPELYDERLPSIDTLWALMLYQTASTLAGQSGRDISDKDIALARTYVGDPKSMWTSPQGVEAKLLQVDQLSSGFDAIDREALGGDGPVAKAPPNLPPGSPPGFSATDTPPPAGTEVWERGPDGVPRRVQ